MASIINMRVLLGLPFLNWNDTNQQRPEHIRNPSTGTPLSLQERVCVRISQCQAPAPTHGIRAGTHRQKHLQPEGWGAKYPDLQAFLGNQMHQIGMATPSMLLFQAYRLPTHLPPYQCHHRFCNSWAQWCKKVFQDTSKLYTSLKILRALSSQCWTFSQGKVQDGQTLFVKAQNTSASAFWLSKIHSPCAWNQSIQGLGAHQQWKLCLGCLQSHLLWTSL